MRLNSCHIFYKITDMPPTTTKLIKIYYEKKILIPKLYREKKYLYQNLIWKNLYIVFFKYPYILCILNFKKTIQILFIYIYIIICIVLFNKFNLIKL